MDLVDICCSPRFSTSTLIDLEVSLQIFFKEFKIVHPNCAVTPKMHFMMLYPYLMKQVGPLTQFSCMRFESKHKYMKKLVTQRNNYKNVPHTIATNHQIAFATSLCRKDLFTFELETNSCSRINAASVFEQFSYCPTASDMITKVKKLTIDGIDYSFGNVLCVGVSINGIPDFISINEILLDNSDVFFCWYCFRNRLL